MWTVVDLKICEISTGEFIIKNKSRLSKAINYFFYISINILSKLCYYKSKFSYNCLIVCAAAQPCRTCSGPHCLHIHRLTAGLWLQPSRAGPSKKRVFDLPIVHFSERDVECNRDSNRTLSFMTVNATRFQTERSLESILKITNMLQVSKLFRLLIYTVIQFMQQ